jgi:hypothetical protein
MSEISIEQVGIEARFGVEVVTEGVCASPHNFVSDAA